MAIKYYPLKVSQQFRDTVRRIYPRLDVEPSGAYWRLMQHVLLSTYTEYCDDTSNGRPRLILPYSYVAAAEGVSHRKHAYAAKPFIHDFETNVMPLHVCESSYTSGKARTIAPDVHPEITSMIVNGDAKGGDEVWFETGFTPSRRKMIANRDLRIADANAAADETPENHPSKKLLIFLNSQPSTTLKSVVRKNKEKVEAVIECLPDKSREWTQRVQLNRNTYDEMIYHTTQKTPRVFAGGTSIHQLPREVRRILFSGEIEVDLVACQLAVAARLWKVRNMLHIIDSGQNVWEVLIGRAGLDMSAKPAIKIAIYSIIFGMTQPNLRETLATKVGWDSCGKLFDQVAVKDLLRARSEYMTSIRLSKGASDADDNWCSLPEPYDSGDVRTLVSWVIQSFEARIMQAILPTIESDPQNHILSWLHDGATLHLGNATKKDRQLVRMIRDVDAVALRFGIPTRLDVKQLA